MKSFLLASLVTAAMATGAHAATLIQGHAGGYFTHKNISNSNNNCLYNTSNGHNTGLAWGNQDTDPNDCPDRSGHYQDSRMIVHDVTIDQVVHGHAHVLVGKISWYNSVNYNAHDFVAGLQLFMDFDNPNHPYKYEYMNLDITNTYNGSETPADNVLAWSFDDFGLALPFELSPLLVLEGFEFKLWHPVEGETLYSYACGKYDDYSCLDWTNPEHNWSTLKIYAKISEVPLPAAGWLLLGGIGGLAAMRRRKKAA